MFNFSGALKRGLSGVRDAYNAHREETALEGGFRDG